MGYETIVIDNSIKKIVAKRFGLSGSRSKPNSHLLLSQVQSRGAMFYGPPSTGKTHLWRAISKESNMAMLAIDGASIFSKLVGEGEKYARAAFTLVAKLYPCILSIDEVDSLFGQRSCDQRMWERSLVNQFLKVIDGLSVERESSFRNRGNRSAG
jgi:SpoVK/Ycf46/Vps4 family AAA+-type ATPase